MAIRRGVAKERLGKLTKGLSEKELKKYGRGVLEKLEGSTKSRGVKSAADLVKLEDKLRQERELEAESGLRRRK